MSTIVTKSRTATSSPVKQLIVGHPLSAYFVIAFAGTWLVLIPLLLAKNGFGLLPFSIPDVGFYALGALAALCGPTLAALTVTAAISGKAGVWRFLRRYLQWRVGILWYALAFFSFLLVFLLSVCIPLGGGPFLAFVKQWQLLFTVFLPTALLVIPFAALGEEPGWSGFALPRLQQRYGPVLGTIVLGTLHSLWHLPTGFIVGGPLYPFGPTTFVTFVLTGIAGTFIYTWIYNHAKGSILIAILIHGAANAVNSVLAFDLPQNPHLSGLAHILYYDGWSNVIAFGMVALLLVVLTRGRLGYQLDRNAQLIETPQLAEMVATNS
ncbi:MAG TPA: CPBP family intramembrane glutamic endopeptidase [Ktedonobacteraceae bacterium]|nr:CPBP family intramembrane glutamic endopeptidase [Ktedonobacteraceae bacterium]